MIQLYSYCLLVSHDVYSLYSVVVSGRTALTAEPLEPCGLNGLLSQQAIDLPCSETWSWEIIFLNSRALSKAKNEISLLLR